MPSIAPIYFHFQVPPFSFTNRTVLKQFLLKQFQKSKRKVETINYIFCTDAQLLELNLGFLQHDTYTDIITFELSGNGQPLLADIYISVDRVRENAQKFNTRFRQELHRVIFHGALHLCGYKDKSQAEADIMRQQEAAWLNAYFVPRETDKH